MITDQDYRNRYLFKDLAPMLPYPDDWYASGALVKDWTIAGLAARIGVPAAALNATISRFNGHARGQGPRSTPRRQYVRQVLR